MSLQRFRDALRAHGKIRLDEPEIWDAFHAAYGHVDPFDERRELLAALSELEQADDITLPRTRAKWVGQGAAALPTFIKIKRPKKERKRPWRDDKVWASELDWVPTLTHVSAHEQMFLNNVDHYLRHGGFPSTVPLKFRSLQLTGDEKRLGTLLSGRFFRPGRLTPELLNIETGPLPLTRETIRPGGRYLIVENEEAFRITRMHLQATLEPPFDAIALGNGHSLERSITWLTHTNEPVTSVHYLGDIDAAGLTIAHAISRIAINSGLPRPQPATPLHEAMLRSAALLGHPQGWPTIKERHKNLTSEQAKELAAFLAPHQRARAEQVLLAGNRIPEEAMAPHLAEALLRCQHLKDGAVDSGPDATDEAQGR